MAVSMAANDVPTQRTNPVTFPSYRDATALAQNEELSQRARAGT